MDEGVLGMCSAALYANGCIDFAVVSLTGTATDILGRCRLPAWQPRMRA